MKSDSGQLLEWLNPTKLIDMIGRTVRRGLVLAPREHVGILVVAFLVSVSVISVNYLENGILEVVTFIAGIAALVVAMILIRPKNIPSTVIPDTESTGSLLGKWSRMVVDLPLLPQTNEELKGRLTSIRTRSAMYRLIRSGALGSFGRINRRVYLLRDSFLAALRSRAEGRKKAVL